MASSADVAKKVARFKLQLTDTARSHTVLKILQKLKDLDITLDILAETGIGKTVNSLRRHEQAGELAKSLVRGWRRLVPKESQSHTEEGDVSENTTVKDEPENQNYSSNQSLTTEDLNNNCLTSQNSSDETLFRSADSEKQCEEHTRLDINEIKNQVKSQQENTTSQHDVWQKKIKIQEAEMGNSVVSKKRKKDRSKSEDSKTMLGNKNSEDTQKSSPESKETLKCTFDSVGLGSEKESDEKSNRSKALSKACKESFSFESADKRVKDAASSETSESSEAQNRERKRTGPEKHNALKHTQESKNEAHSKQKNKKTKIKPKDKKSDGDPEPSVSFESVLNYDVNRLKRKERSRVKKPQKRIKTATEEAMNYPGMKPLKSPEMCVDVSSPKLFREPVMDLMNIPLPAALPDIGFEYFERKAEKETNVCDISEESAGFTGQRLNKKMQVYSGAKTVFLPTMMSLRQQCIRIVQNNIDLLYETGPLVPFEILKPVLERCTPEQLLRVEECNPIYIGETDHLWGKHCQRDFKDSKLQEYESWKEMYIRLYEERERKLQRLTKTIVSAQSNKPKCRQVKMAFIHTVAKPPRDVRIQQEIHGTAAQQPHQLSAKVQDNRPRLSYSEPGKSSSTTSGAGNTQDPRKKTRVAPMMAKSLKAFKKQLGRR